MLRLPDRAASQARLVAVVGAAVARVVEVKRHKAGAGLAAELGFDHP